MEKTVADVLFIDGGRLSFEGRADNNIGEVVFEFGSAVMYENCVDIELLVVLICRSVADGGKL